MIYFTDDYIDNMIKEDVPYIDLTTRLLGISEDKGRISFVARQGGVVTSTDVVEKIFSKLGAETAFSLKNGDEVNRDEEILRVCGSAIALHAGWKCCLNVLEYTMGISTKSHKIFKEARRGNSRVSAAFTRKSFPGTKQLSVAAAMDGGLVPHRLGLSETILIFNNHLEFLGGLGGLKKIMDDVRKNSHEKKITVEVSNLEDALFLTSIGVDAIQLDKIPSSKLSIIVEKIRGENRNITIVATGGIDEGNAYEYAGTGVDVIATSSPFYAKPFDIKASIRPYLA